MATRQARYGPEEFARRGQDIFDRVVGPALRPEDDNKFVAIDIESDGYEIDAKDHAATERLRKRYPDAQIWLMRVGHPATYRLGRR